MAAYFSKIDLHSHSTASDGALTPTELVNRAVNRGLTHLALTDHDCVLGLDEAIDAAKGSLYLIPGSELSATWNNNQIHVAALFIDYKCDAIKDYILNQRSLRVQRAEEIGEKLDRQGFKNSYDECKKRAGEGASITRGNFARYIVEMGRASTTDEAFELYLKKGKSCYVKTAWPDISVTVDAILKSGGVPVLA
ncbi:MAG: PHP domain-containing protein, partial [Succinivibrio sp.]